MHDEILSSVKLAAVHIRCVSTIDRHDTPQPRICSTYEHSSRPAAVALHCGMQGVVYDDTTSHTGRTPADAVERVSDSSLSFSLLYESRCSSLVDHDSDTGC